MPDAAAPAAPLWQRVLFVLLAVLTLVPGVNPALALGVGAAFALTLGNPFEKQSAKLSKQLLKACVIGLGFGMALPAVLKVGAQGVWATALGLALALGVGLLLGRLLKVESTTSTLISGGTAICGGSAIAALGPVLGAGAEAMSVALATVFVLNGVALYLFPPIGHALGLSQGQFALWAALAIHDTSSVVGAASAYGKEALAQATVLKLTRALWIIPLTLAVAWWRRRGEGGAAKVALPWFIGGFALASAVRALVPAGAPVFDAIVAVARQGLVLTLFLIGAGLSRGTLRRLGVRPLVQGVLLWLVVAGTSLALILFWGA